MDEDIIPIDIQCNKLVDWLIDRRHCNIKWQTAAEVVKEKIAAALNDMPNTQEMQKLLEGSCFHYFKCLKIVDVLKDTEKGSKNIFGMYSSKRMKDWQEIVKLYEKENLHLAELSSRLLRNLNYEIPAIKKQILKCGQLQQECKKKMQDCDRNTREVHRKYAEECKKVGIPGKNVRKELFDLVCDLPQEFDNMARKCKDIFSVLEYYVSFVEYSLSSDKYSSEVTPMIRHLSTVGNSTVYQWKHGVVPDRVMRTELKKCEEVDKDIDGEIDWGTTLEVETEQSNDVINFDIDATDLGIVVENSGDNDNEKETDNGFEVIASDETSWEIEEVSMSEVPNGKSLVQTEIVAEGEDALTVLECATTRTIFINELMEVLGFLSQRLAETELEADVLSINQFSSAPPILQLTSAAELRSMQDLVLSIYNSMTSTKMVQLCRILGSSRFVDRIADNLGRELALTKKYESLKSSHEDTIRHSEAEESSLHPKIKLLVSEVKEWQKLIETEISKRYKDRPVHLMGSLNLL